MSTTILREDTGPVAVLTLNRPEAFNAFNGDFLDAFSAAVRSVGDDPAIRAVVITGAGKAFCAGGDLKQLIEHPGGSAAGFLRLAGRFHEGILAIATMPKPVIAAVNGVAAGGGFSLALACDLRIMARCASLKCAYGSAALTLDGGGSWTLPRLVGRAKALEIALLDKPIPADHCLALGLATRVVDDGTALSEALTLAQELAQRSSHATGWAKHLLNASEQNTLTAQLDLERLGIAACGSHPDGQEGMQAFAQKRRPNFTA
jgi:2-(1,2-epoxy-1,2-dihydrophenyl)acetyl-CoA isomerase